MFDIYLGRRNEVIAWRHDEAFLNLFRPNCLANKLLQTNCYRQTVTNKLLQINHVQFVSNKPLLTKATYYKQTVSNKLRLICSEQTITNSPIQTPKPPKIVHQICELLCENSLEVAMLTFGKGPVFLTMPKKGPRHCQFLFFVLSRWWQLKYVFYIHPKHWVGSAKFFCLKNATLEGIRVSFYIRQTSPNKIAA